MERHILEQYTDVQREEKDIAKRIERLEDEIQKMEMNGYMVADSVTCGKKRKEAAWNQENTRIPISRIRQKEKGTEKL